MRNNFWQHIDWPLVLIYLVLAVFGIFNIYSAEHGEGTSIFSSGLNSGAQIKWLIASLFLATAILFIDARFFLTFAYYFFVGVAILLVITFLTAPEVKGDVYKRQVVWEGGARGYVSLNNVPNHVDVAVGQKVVVNSYSYIFPEGTPIGVIEEFDLSEGTAFYNIKVKLYSSMRNIEHVYVVDNVGVTPKNALEESVIE